MLNFEKQKKLIKNTKNYEKHKKFMKQGRVEFNWTYNEIWDHFRNFESKGILIILAIKEHSHNFDILKLHLMIKYFPNT